MPKTRFQILFLIALMILSSAVRMTEDSQGDPRILDHGSGLFESVWDFQNVTNYTFTNTTVSNNSVLLDSGVEWWNQTSQSDFESATQTINIDTTTQPGEIRLENTSTPTTLTRIIQPGPLDIKDSYIMSGGGQNMNYGTSNQLRLVGGAPNIIKRSFIQFNLSSLPPTSTISQATLQLYYYQSIAGNPTSVSVHRTTHWWSEMGLTYNDYDGTHPWTTAGGDFDPFNYDVQTLQDGVFGWISWDVTPLLQSWLDGSYANLGLLLKQVNDSTDSGVDPAFYSSDDAGFPDRHPRLIVNFSSLDLVQNGAFSTDLNWTYDRSPSIMVGWNPLEQNVLFEHTADSHPNSSAEALPRSGGGTGGDGDPVDETRWDDGFRFVVRPTQDMFIDTFDTAGLSGNIEKVTLNAKYMVEAPDYHGYNAIEYIDCWGIRRVTEIQPLPFEIMDTNKSYDITSACDSWTWLDVTTIQIFFMNDDIARNRFVAFDRVWITIELESFSETAYLNQTFSKSIRTGFFDTTQDDFKRGNVSTVDIDLSPGDVVLQSMSDTRTIPFKPDPLIMKDTTLIENLPDQNFGISPFLELSYDPIMGVESRAILDFNLRSLPIVSVNSALLRLYFFQDFGMSDLTVTVYRLLSPWDEMTATWNERMIGQRWTREGGDVNLWPYDTITILSGNLGWVEWNITELVQGWVDGDYPNYGLLLRAVGGDNQSPYRFASSDSLNPADWPELLLNVSARVYQLTGTYLSSVEYYNPDKLDAYIQWTGTIQPSVTDLIIQTRTGTDPDPILNPDQWESWKPAISYTNSSGQLIKSSPAPYIQYRVILNTNDPGETPILSDICVSWRDIQLTFDNWIEGQDGLTVVDLTVVIDSVPVWTRFNLSVVAWKMEKANVSKHLVDPGIHNISFQLHLGTNTTGPSKLVLLLDNVTMWGTAQDWANGIFHSEIYDATHTVIWGDISWSAAEPPGTIVAIGTRSGSTPAIDGNWSSWSPYSIASGEPIQSPVAQYLQYKVYLVTTIPANNPSVSDVSISYWHHYKNGEVETIDFIPTNITVWDVFDANATTQDNTSIEFFYSTDSGGLWTSTMPGENLSLVPIPKIRFKAILGTDNGSVSPELSEMKLLYWVQTAGPLDHIHMSLDTWTGTADEWVDLDAVGHAADHTPMSFQANWSTTDLMGVISPTGLYEPGAAGSWRVYCNNTNNTISNYTAVTILPGAISRIAVNPWQVSPLTTDDDVLFTATGYDS
ncbi:MAG: DNRLRE domain-containing protein [Methanobacteriota archaeon]|nr:MAG: DNRLRE domain-containing protein [Euryarchaeota archaeon]